MQACNSRLQSLQPGVKGSEKLQQHAQRGVLHQGILVLDAPGQKGPRHAWGSHAAQQALRSRAVHLWGTSTPVRSSAAVSCVSRMLLQLLQGEQVSIIGVKAAGLCTET